MPDISIDYAVMEQADNVAVIGCDLGWSDVGSWTALASHVEQDGDGNNIEGEALAFTSHNCYIRSEDRLVATLGVDDLIIVDTSDALLVAHKNSAQDVKKVVEYLKEVQHPVYRTHSTVHRPWGTYTELERGERFKIKRIMVKPKASLSLQMHYHRCEHWVVVSGTARIVNGDKEILLKTNESTFIPSGEKHRLENPGKVPLVLIEVQSGEYLGEDDIVRFSDVYGRH
jgi:mannose-1-phosphate guanylyltransferase